AGRPGRRRQDRRRAGHPVRVGGGNPRRPGLRRRRGVPRGRPAPAGGRARLPRRRRDGRARGHRHRRAGAGRRAGRPAPPGRPRPRGAGRAGRPLEPGQSRQPPPQRPRPLISPADPCNFRQKCQMTQTGRSRAGSILSGGGFSWAHARNADRRRPSGRGHGRRSACERPVPAALGLTAPLPPTAAGAGSSRPPAPPSGPRHGPGRGPVTGTRWTAARDGPAAGRDAPFWDALDDGERAALRRVARPRRYPPGAPLCFQGDDSDHLVVIESGWAKVTSSGEDGREVVLAVRGPGELVCESAVLGGRERSATVTALGPVRALVVPAARFTGFLDAHPGVWRLVSGTFVRRLDDASRRLQAHVSAHGARRLAILLSELADLSARHAPPDASGAVVLGPPLSQEELGSWMDASRETVARALAALRAEGLVRTGRRKITVLDPAG